MRERVGTADHEGVEGEARIERRAAERLMRGLRRKLRGACVAALGKPFLVSRAISAGSTAFSFAAVLRSTAERTSGRFFALPAAPPSSRRAACRHSATAPSSSGSGSAPRGAPCPPRRATSSIAANQLLNTSSPTSARSRCLNAQPAFLIGQAHRPPLSDGSRRGADGKGAGANTRRSVREGRKLRHPCFRTSLEPKLNARSDGRELRNA